MSRNGIAANVKVRIYFEGMLIPSAGTSVVVQGAVGGPATAQLNITPTNTSKHIMPGTWVHVFTTDPWDLNPKGDASDYKLLFEGVVIGRGFQRQGEGRSFVLNCADPSIYWVEARQFWLNITSAGGGIVDQLAVQTSGGYGRFVMSQSSGVYSYALSKLTNIKEGEERFLDTMIAVLDDIGNVNPFYTNVRNRFRLTDRIIRAPAGKTEKLFQLALLGDFLNGLAQRASGQSTLVEVVNELLSAILHEWVPVVAPPYIKARILMRDGYGNIKRNKTTVRHKDSSGNVKATLFAFETAEDDIVAGMMFKPHLYTISPPSCNVLFPNMYNSTGFQENFLSEPTRTLMQPQLIMQNLQNVATGLMFMRPTELEIFTAITRDKKNNARGKRDPDAHFADGEGQTPTYQDYDWSTNEERIRGIVTNFINMGPAPATLTIADPGKREPSGTRKGGMPKYLQNVVSYEYFKAKFVQRQTGLTGPYNMRPILGLPMLALDDSAANVNIMAYLQSILHSISADGAATTQYGLMYPRLADEVDFNRPKFKGGITASGELDLDAARTEDGQFQFERAFDGVNRPPIPEWFSEDWKSLQGLDVTYRKFFGDKCKVLESILFNDPTKAGEAATQEALATGQAYGLALATGAAATSVTSSQNDMIDQLAAVNELNRRFRASRDMGREFEQASEFTDRSFTRIGDAFRFVGAAPLEVVDAEGREAALTTSIDYARHKLSRFVGVTANGFGFSGVKEGESAQPPVTTITDGDGDVKYDSSLGPQGRAGVMGAAFPLFDTKIHVGDDALNKTKRAALQKSEGLQSDQPRYDGRPQMYDFEFRLWQASLVEAGFTADGEKIAEGADQADYYVTSNGETRRATPEEQAANTKKRQDALAATSAKNKSRRAGGGAHPKSRTNHPANKQAPTGDSAESSEKLPLPQPLSERQVIALRRAVIEAYANELEKNRGFTG